MSDYNSSLPVRTEAAGDVAVKIVDSTITSQQLTVNADGSINVGDNGASLTVDAVNLDIRDLAFATDTVDVSGSSVELGATTLAALESITVQNGAGAAAVNIQDGGNSITVDGTVELGATTLAALETITVTATDLDIRDLAFATDSVDVSGSSVELGATTLAALESITVQNGAGAAAVNIQDGGNSITVDGTVELGATTLAALETITVTATDLDIRDLTHVSDSIKIGDGTDLLAINADGSINVVISNDVTGTEVCSYQTSAAVAGGASVNFDYTVTAATTMIIEQAFCSGSGKIKAEVKVETAAASGVYTTKFVGFNSTATPNIDIDISRYLKQVAGAKVRITITNRDNQAQDVYATLTGSES